MKNIYKQSLQSLRLYGWWKKVAEKIGNFQTTVLFSVLYFILITPVGIVASLFRDFLDIHRKPTWKTMENRPFDLSNLKLQ